VALTGSRSILSHLIGEAAGVGPVQAAVLCGPVHSAGHLHRSWKAQHLARTPTRMWRLCIVIMLLDVSRVE
jgi:hypothetical protein